MGWSGTGLTYYYDLGNFKMTVFPMGHVIGFYLASIIVGWIIKTSTGQ